MDLLSESLIIVRHLIDDVGTTEEFSNSRLSSLIFVAAAYVNNDIGASYDIGLSCQTITPDPDMNFIILVSFKAACMLTRSLHLSLSRNDFKVQDGPTTVDLKGGADKIKEAADSFCNKYEKSKLDHLMGRSLNGAFISTPNSDSY